MIKNSIKNLSGLVILSFSIQAVANDTIRVHVKTNEKTAAALGYTVDGKKSGARGKSYEGKGPVNREYVFGYRKNSAFGPDVLCGSHVLTKDSIVTLITKGERCSIVVN
ncbi:hypothetical protein OQJ19_09180 [Fluoribacter gormanii]|uniref:Uncharacterized protein n=1 Tax=Fluoribacter gormanii TaxID=464 RepID=A0A377GNI6_9GAMM|nr:hypothetical protein [Fluoribacter gormanii]KTD05130.1 hypothetical protein Lgor_0761 [Fluoribacter gormanii]MCW8470821.1 hypothetical protein [Fluoribacter gormanii]SIR00292.1 hypothetical protein SAMN05421777_10584 [Fluoribacter gormanii]STO26055.1 Uncharacterised protein [Fluoribacter gormanii]